MVVLFWRAVAEWADREQLALAERMVDAAKVMATDRSGDHLIPDSEADLAPAPKPLAWPVRYSAELKEYPLLAQLVDGSVPGQGAEAVYAFAGLTRKQGDAWGRHLLGMSTAEIAREMREAPGVVEKYIWTARERIQQAVLRPPLRVIG